MARLPAVCKSCGRAHFTPEGAFVGDFGGLYIEDVQVGGSCPFCGGDGQIMQAGYKLTGNAVQILTQLAPDDRLALRDLLQSIPRTASSDEVAKRLNEAVPDAPELAEKFRLMGVGWYGWAVLIIMVLTLALDAGSKADEIMQGQQPPSDPKVEQLLREVIELQKKGLQQPTPRHAPRPQLARGDPCWCGSGKKYKHWHGRR